MDHLRPPLPLLVRPLLERALHEDLGRAGDLTTDAIVPAQARARALLVARRGGRIAGLPFAAQTVALLDPAVRFAPRSSDGADVVPGTVLAEIAGPARALLTGERTALNLLSRLSGIATATRDLVAALERSPPYVVCTRKTTPGLRALEKYAVRAGGGHNHRFGLDDAILIKDNHVAFAGGVDEAVARARSAAGHLVKIELEVDSLAQLERALALGVDAVLLDNFSLGDLRRAVRLVGGPAGRAVTEASGGITPARASAIAATGVDLLSVGWLTHSAPALDLALDVLPPAAARRRKHQGRS